MICYLYTFPNGKKYCGITKNTIEQRASTRYKGQRVGDAIKKYGWQNVKKEILLESDDEKLIQQKEIDVISELNLLDSNYGYNVSPGGNYQTPETRKQISETVKRLWDNPSYREHMEQAFEGRHHTDETKNQISETMKKKFIDNPELRIERSEKMKLAYQNGNRDNAIKKSIEAKRQPVIKCDDNGNIIAIFSSAVEAYREYCPNAKVDKAIYRVLSGERQHYKGFKYKRITKEEEEELRNGISGISNNS